MGTSTPAPSCSSSSTEKDRTASTKGQEPCRTVKTSFWGSDGHKRGIKHFLLSIPAASSETQSVHPAIGTRYPSTHWNSSARRPRIPILARPDPFAPLRQRNTFIPTNSLPSTPQSPLRGHPVTVSRRLHEGYHTDCLLGEPSPPKEKDRKDRSGLEEQKKKRNTFYMISFTTKPRSYSRR